MKTISYLIIMLLILMTLNFILYNLGFLDDVEEFLREKFNIKDED